VGTKKRADANLKNVHNAVKLELLKKNKEEISLFLNTIYEKFSVESFLNTDPIYFPKTLSGNTEYIAFVSSLFAYGKVDLIKRFLNTFFQTYGTDPLNFFNNERNIYYRFQNNKDIIILTKMISFIYKNFGSLENMFYQFSDNLEIALKSFLLYAKIFGEENGADKGFYFLFPEYGKSALKRFRMFLRWMVRNKDIDFGLWKKYDKSELFYPMDTHILHFALNNNIIKSSSNTHKNMVTVTDFFKTIDSSDPLKYDFPLTRLGMLYKCKYKYSINCEYCKDFAKNCIFIQN